MGKWKRREREGNHTKIKIKSTRWAESRNKPIEWQKTVASSNRNTSLEKATGGQRICQYHKLQQMQCSGFHILVRDRYKIRSLCNWSMKRSWEVKIFSWWKQILTKKRTAHLRSIHTELQSWLSMRNFTAQQCQKHEKQEQPIHPKKILQWAEGAKIDNQNQTWVCSEKGENSSEQRVRGGRR